MKMKTTRVWQKSLFLLAIMVMLIVPTAHTRAASKVVFAGRTKRAADSCIKGTNYITSFVSDSYVKFTAPAAAMYTIRVSEFATLDEEDYEDDINCGSVFFYDKYGDFDNRMIVSNEGVLESGEAASIATEDFCNVDPEDNEKYRPSRYFKLSMNKGETIYMNVTFTDSSFQYKAVISAKSMPKTGTIQSSVHFKSLDIMLKVYYKISNGEIKINSGKEHACQSPKKALKNPVSGTVAYSYPRMTSNKKVFTMRKGEKFYPQKFRVTKNYCYLYVKNTAGKKGWIIFTTASLKLDYKIA